MVWVHPGCTGHCTKGTLFMRGLLYFKSALFCRPTHERIQVAYFFSFFSDEGACFNLMFSLYPLGGHFADLQGVRSQDFSWGGFFESNLS